jgi:Heterokaryon incompatibility protein (HET)
MRLLNTRSFELDDFGNGTVPQYAFFSHTWGPEEVLFREMVHFHRTAHSDLRPKAGFRKIELACQRALRDGLQYIWVDTCCMDKSSGAELSEAISLMFG